MAAFSATEGSCSRAITHWKGDGTRAVRAECVLQQSTQRLAGATSNSFESMVALLSLAEGKDDESCYSPDEAEKKIEKHVASRNVIVTTRANLLEPSAQRTLSLKNSIIIYNYAYSLPRFSRTLNSHPVFAFTSASVTPSARSISSSSPLTRSTSKAASSVII